MSIIQLVKTALLGPVRLILGAEKYETLRYYGYCFLARDQGYTKRYYESIEAANSKAYDLLAQALVAVFHPSSVVDVGCGSGGISIALLDRGVRDIFPFDFSEASIAMAKSRGLLFAKQLDLTRAQQIPAAGDLCICLEVAEHIPKKFEQHVVWLLAQVSPTLVFTAAPPGQGGHLHVNLATQDHWALLFKEAGMRPNIQMRDRLLEHFSGRMIHDYSANLMVFTKSQAP
jgi:SAM-dependent methyltransferase